MSSERLNVVTAVSRPQNLACIQRHLAERLASFDVRWYCVADSNHVVGQPPGIECVFWGESATADCAGGAQKNVALDQVDGGWVCFLDDDNTIHPQFDRALANAIRSRPDCVGHVFGQVDGSCRLLRQAARQFVRNGRLDLGQFVLRHDVLAQVRFPINVYNSDWLLFEQVWREHADRIAFRGPATFYNALAAQRRS
jgi:Glycosyl transferase family 2